MEKKRKVKKKRSEKKEEVKGYECIYIDIHISQKSSQDVFDRYDAAITNICRMFFSKNIGDWSGRETGLGSNDDMLNYFIIKYNCKNEAEQIIEQVLDNFNMKENVLVKISSNVFSDKNFYKEFDKQTEMEWSYTFKKNSN